MQICFMQKGKRFKHFTSNKGRIEPGTDEHDLKQIRKKTGAAVAMLIYVLPDGELQILTNHKDKYGRMVTVAVEEDLILLAQKLVCAQVHVDSQKQKDILEKQNKNREQGTEQ